MNGHSRHRAHGIDATSSVMSSDIETTSFFDSEDDASSRYYGFSFINISFRKTICFEPFFLEQDDHLFVSSLKVCYQNTAITQKSSYLLIKWNFPFEEKQIPVIKCW